MLLQSRNTDELGCTTGPRLYTPETENACDMNMNIAPKSYVIGSLCIDWCKYIRAMWFVYITK